MGIGEFEATTTKYVKKNVIYEKNEKESLRKVTAIFYNKLLHRNAW